MCTELKLQSKDEALYLPEPAEILEIRDFNTSEKFFRLGLKSGKSLNHTPGQFVQISVLGYGEAPICVSSPYRDDNTLDVCVRAVGTVTNKMHTMKVGDVLHVRGPFGNGFVDPMKRIKGKHVVFVAGGTGYFPLRSLINTVLDEADQYKKISILYGCKSDGERVYKDELEKISRIGGNVELLETVDNASDDWKGNCGVITTLIPKVDFDPAETIAVIVGPPIMYKFVLKSLLDRKISKENIYMSLERRMKCAVGKCGHCQMEGVYVCQEGPVFCYADVESNEEVF